MDLGTTGVSASSPLERRGSLDGLRALAVVAVAVYHADHRLLPGGFIGVDLFFVLSGYLITTLLVAEHRRRGAVSLRSFWTRRIRRLWPLAWATLAAVATVSLTGVWGPDRQRALPGELGAALVHLANWHQIGSGGYVASFTAPSPLRHFWSLAIEEQFYLLWPLVLVAALRVGRRHRSAVPLLLGAIGALSVASGLAHASSPDRAYLGTDVRMIALVVGAAAAWVLRAHPLEGPARSVWRRAACAAGVAGGVALVAMAATVDADSPILPVGGFLLIALAAGGVVVAALTSDSARSALSWAPLAWLGRISFALYLVHWPLLVALGPGRSTALRLVVALPVSIGIAAVAHRVIERPVMVGSLQPRRLVTAGVALALVASVATIWSTPDGLTPTERVEQSLGRVADPVAAPASASGPTTTGQPEGERTATSTGAPCPGIPPTPTSSTTAPSERFDPATVRPVADPGGTTCGDPLDVLVVGDSTGRGAANGLAALADPRVRIWDRTVLGCSYGDETCPDWRPLWTQAVSEIHPDLVLVYAGVVSDFHGVDDPPFLSSEAHDVRTDQLRDAVVRLSAKGAEVAMVTVAEPLRPNGLFFCDGVARGSNCDPRWVARWNDSVRDVTGATGATLIDVAGWIGSRGSTAADRPDGLHLAGPALAAEASWLVPRLLA